MAIGSDWMSSDSVAPRESLNTCKRGSGSAASSETSSTRAFVLAEAFSTKFCSSTGVPGTRRARFVPASSSWEIRVSIKRFSREGTTVS